MTSQTHSKPKFIPYSRQNIDDADVKAVVDVLKSDFLTTGPKVTEFENAVAQKIGTKYAVSFSSGTAALHGSMFAAKLEPGDEVLVPTLSFAATANCVQFLGAKPVFVDTTKDGLNLDLNDAKKKLSPNTKAIIPVHFAGEPVDLDQIHSFAKTNKLIVVEDSAHALGAKRNGQSVGSTSDMAIFSFHPVKHITTGEGGIVTTNNETFYKRLKKLRNHGIELDAATREKTQSWFYDMTELGFNYRLTDIQAALGISQLKKLDDFIKQRKTVANQYFEIFKNEPMIAVPPKGLTIDTHAWHLFVIRLNEKLSGEIRDQIFKDMRTNNIGVQIHYRPIHLHSYYAQQKNIEASCPNAERQWKQFLSLPIYPGLSNEDIDRVGETLKKIINKYA